MVYHPDRLEALEIVKVPDAVDTRTVEEILFPALENLTPGMQRLVEEKLNALTNLDENRGKAKLLLELRQQGHTIRQVGRALKLSDTTVKLALRRARKAGLLNDTAETLAYEAAPLAAETVMKHLRKGSEKSAHRVLEGLGHLKNYSFQKHEGAAGIAMPPLQVNVVFGANTTGPAATVPQLETSEAVVGQPREDP